MSKILVIEGLGFRWEIDADVIAQHRADYYSAKADPTDRNAVFEDEYVLTLEDDELLVDWYLGDMEWNDVPMRQKRQTRTPFLGTPPDLERALQRWKAVGQGAPLAYSVELRKDAP